MLLQKDKYDEIRYDTCLHILYIMLMFMHICSHAYIIIKNNTSLLNLKKIFIKNVHIIEYARE